MQQLGSKFVMLWRHHGLQHGFELSRFHIGIHPFVFLRDDDVDAVGLVADVGIDPVEFFLDALRRKADQPQHAEATGPGDFNDDITAVGEGKDRRVDTEQVTK